MKTLVTGLKPSGQLTLGNYIGTIKPLKEMQKEYNCFVFVANLHSITVPQEKLELKNNTLELAKMLMACGIDSKNINMFVQSDILEHSQLGYLLLTISSMDELKKMTQFKDKSSKGIKMPNGTTTIPTGLFTYPTLMAADILLYQADVVPVGHDQIQHLELTKTLGDRINNRFGEVFKIPQTIISKECSRIMSLTDPTSKMSKSSDSAKSYILLEDDPKLARKKIMSAKTDSENVVKYDKKNKPGVSNLIEIYASLNNLSIKDAENILKDKNYKEFKEVVADSVETLLISIQSKHQTITKNNVIDMLNEGKQQAQKVAYKTLQKIQNKMGVNYEKR